MEILIATRNKAYSNFLTQYQQYIEDLFFYLQTKYDISLPKQITFRPLRKLSKQYIYRRVWANAGWSYAVGYFIGLDMKSNMEAPEYKVFDNISHEVAHIVECLYNKTVSHGEVFQEIEKRAMDFLRENYQYYKNPDVVNVSKKVPVQQERSNPCLIA